MKSRQSLQTIWLEDLQIPRITQEPQRAEQIEWRKQPQQSKHQAKERSDQRESVSSIRARRTSHPRRRSTSAIASAKAAIGSVIVTVDWAIRSVVANSFSSIAYEDAFETSGGHGTRTRNPLRGTTFPVWPLAIRLPSGESC